MATIKNLVLLPHTWKAGSETVTVKNTWDVVYHARNFVVKKSSFGWHVDEQVGEEYKRGVFGILHDNKTAALQAIINNA